MERNLANQQVQGTEQSPNLSELLNTQALPHPIEYYDSNLFKELVWHAYNPEHSIQLNMAVVTALTPISEQCCQKYQRAYDTFMLALNSDVDAIAKVAKQFLVAKHGRPDPRFTEVNYPWNDFQADCLIDPDVPHDVKEGIIKLFKHYKIYGVGHKYGIEVSFPRSVKYCSGH